MSAQSGLWPFFSFYGGKWRAAPRYPRPEFGRIVEPFAGSAGYSVRYPDRDVLLIDADPVVASVWEYLISASVREVLSLPLDAGDLATLDPGARALVGFWLNKGGASPGRTPSAWMRSGIRPNSYWGEVIRARIASQLSSIRHWRVINGDYRQAPDEEATWFIDPPYSSAAGRLYKYSNIDYPALGQWAERRRGQVVVCEGQGADWMPFSPHMGAKSTPGSRGKGYSQEVMWTR